MLWCWIVCGWQSAQLDASVRVRFLSLYRSQLSRNRTLTARPTSSFPGFFRTISFDAFFEVPWIGHGGR